MRLTILILLLASGCTPHSAPTSPGTDAPGTDTSVGQFASEADYRAQRERTARALEAAITPATASSVAACRVVPTSEQACGGPTTFAVYSAEASDSAEVERLASRLVALDVQANGQFEWASTCMAYSPPTPTLVGGRCVAAR